MNPDLLLSSAAALAGFVLKISLGFVLCWLLSVIVTSPAGKFMAWLGFLSGAAAYWVWLVAAMLPGRHASVSQAASSGSSAEPAISVWHLPSSWARPLSIALCAFGVFYVSALAGFLINHVRKRLRLRWVVRFAYQPPAEIAGFFEPLARSLGSASCKLLVLSGITSPATFGWLRPTILLPDFCLEQDRSDLEDILRHELHHVRRWDFVSNALGATCRALLFFHPAVWYAMRKMQLERELACDLAVVSSSPERRAQYAECLVRFARINLAGQTRPWDLDFAAPAHMKARIRSVLSESKQLSSWVFSLRTCGGLALFAIFAGVAPSLGVAFSYVQRHIAPPVATTVLTVPARLEVRKRPVRIARVWKNAATEDAIAPRAVEERRPEEVQIIQPGPALQGRDALAPERGSQEAASEGSATADAEPSDAKAKSGSRTGSPSISGVQRRSIASILTNAALHVGMIGDRDHGRDGR
ncbi:MAG TPA: M56 family metallopeptidase [Acidobacteriaceae bacterium]|nr:M56 family metallopeptidase [Acidobacteriaceae bacterium]